MTRCAKAAWALSFVLAAVVLIYGSHLHNSFHFDDEHTIVNNPYVRDIHNLPRFFVDPNIGSVLPDNRVYRPVLFASILVDYWLGHGLMPLWFHISTLVWFLVEIVLIFFLSRTIFDRVSPEADHSWTALFAAAVYGLHPVMAETVNYVIQRAELLSTLGVVAGLVVYIAFPALRKFGLYLIPAGLGMLSKQPALVFPLILFLYLWFIEEEQPRRALVQCVPAIALTAAVGILSALMTPTGFNPAVAGSAFAYRITQPLVLLRHFSKFFVPTGLSADTDHQALGSFFDDGVIQGFLFVAALIGAMVWCVRRKEMRPVALGLGWFLVASLPASIFVISEVENDHRMFFPFVGLAIAASWAMARPLRHPAGAVASVLLLIVFGYATWVRCEVWKTDESLWRDVTIKSPYNGRGLMNYGLVLMARADYPDAYSYFERAATLLPSYYVLEINRAIVNGAMRNNAEAEKHFARAISLAPNASDPKFYYARWLGENGRDAQAEDLLRACIRQNPAYIEAYYLLMQTYSKDGDGEAVHAAALQTLAAFPGDTTATGWLTRTASITVTPEAYLNRSLALYQAGNFAECIAAAQKALAIRPNYGDAWNNIAAAYNAQGKWVEGIAAGETAVRLNPNSSLARNNLAWAVQQKARLDQAKSRP